MENPDANSGEEPKAKKTDKAKKPSKKVKDELLVKNAIDINPKLEEAPNNTVVLGWGRMNPITVGHEKLVNKIKAVARQESATPLIYISHSQDAKKNPLDYDDKIMLAKKAFGNKLIVKSNSRTIIQIMQELQKKFSRVVLVVGQDRIKQFDELLNKYNGKDYNFDNISIVSAGDRDPDSEGVDGMSASKMRAAASQGDFKSFKTGLPRRLQGDAQDVYDMVRGGMKIAEMFDLEEALTIQQRRQRGITMRRFKSKIAQGRRRMAKKAASMDKLKIRARKAAIQIIRKKVAGKKGEKYATLSPSEKMLIDKRVATKKSAVDRIAKKLLPQVRKADLAKLSKKTTNEEFEAWFYQPVNEEFEAFLFNEDFTKIFEEPTVGQDKDIADRKGTQPAVYHKGLAKSTKVKRDAHFKKGAKMDDDNPDAYEPAPGDAEAKTKTSTHTKRYHQMFTKEGGIKLDRRFRAFRTRKEEVELDEIAINTDAEKRLKRQHKDERGNLSKEHEREMDGLLTRELRKKITSINKEEFESDKDLIAFIEETTNDIFDQVMLDEEKGNEGLKKKAEKSGMPLGILKKVYDRGIAAWKTGHRPGTTPQQWGFARVNSFITKSSGTWGKADADLAAKVRKESIEEGSVNPAQRAAIAISKKAKAGKPGYDSEGKSLKEDDPCWASHEQKGMKKKNGKLVPNCVPKEDVNEAFEELFTEKSPVEMIKGRLGLKLYKKQYDHALKTLKDLVTRKKKETTGPKGSMRHDIGYYAAQIARSYQNVDAKLLAGMLKEDGGAGDKGTDKVTKRYKKDTPGENINEDVTQKQLQDLEKFGDRLLAKFKIDIEFTRHFADRMNDARNKPAITVAELQKVFKKIAKRKAVEIRKNPDSEAVLKDMQADLNLPIVINYDKNKDEYEVVNKTIMRKKNFGTSDKVIEI